jgi:hypothetical protein
MSFKETLMNGVSICKEKIGGKKVAAGIDAN